MSLSALDSESQLLLPRNIGALPSQVVLAIQVAEGVFPTHAAPSPLSLPPDCGNSFITNYVGSTEPEVVLGYVCSSENTSLFYYRASGEVETSPDLTYFIGLGEKC